MDRHDDRHDAAVRVTADLAVWRRRPPLGTTNRDPSDYALAAGYLLAWTAFSLGATALQRLLASLMLVSPMMEPVNSRVSATLLLAAGVYQWTPLKHACLRQCRSPIGFLMGRWRSGLAGALRMGLEHGNFCVGCCWALMLLLFAAGVMNVLIIVGLTALVAFEKLAPLGLRHPIRGKDRSIDVRILLGRLKDTIAEDLDLARRPRPPGSGCTDEPVAETVPNTQPTESPDRKLRRRRQFLLVSNIVLGAD